MKIFLRTISIASAVIALSIVMAVLPSMSGLQNNKSEVDSVYVLEKETFYESLNTSRENALVPSFKIEVAKKVQEKSAEKKSVERDTIATKQSSLTSLGYVPESKSKIAGSDVILTTYQNPDPDSESKKQAAAFTQLISPVADIKVRAFDVAYFRLSNPLERVEQLNQKAGVLGLEITPEMYFQFTAGDKASRIEQITLLAEQYGVSVNQETIENFVEESSKLLEVSPL